MFPRLFTFDTPEFLRGIFPEHISVYSYGFFIAMGVLVSYYFMSRRVARYGVDSDKLAALFMWVILASFVGGRIFFFFEDLSHFVENPREMLRFSGGGFVFYGSLVFAVPTMVWWLRKEKVPVRPFLDIVAFAGPIVHSFGRVGCFMAGCCHGKVCSNFLGVTFDHPESLARPLHTPLYPTQLFDIGINIVILIVLVLLSRNKKFAGQLFLVYIVLYAIGRSINELFRGDEARGFVFGTGISHSQFIAFLLLIISALIWVRWSKRDENRL
ncbi:MAG: prolipoprotein diacylglyceryl transferase [Flavobacteriales bacterium]|nr:prolipoprotein diacylglyceryl transferase [Flavobacteriales bacterium]